MPDGLIIQKCDSMLTGTNFTRVFGVRSENLAVLPQTPRIASCCVGRRVPSISKSEELFIWVDVCTASTLENACPPCTDAPASFQCLSNRTRNLFTSKQTSLKLPKEFLPSIAVRTAVSSTSNLCLTFCPFPTISTSNAPHMGIWNSPTIDSAVFRLVRKIHVLDGALVDYRRLSSRV